MGDKSVQKRKYIVRKAKEVFCKSGYKAVTMKDIVDACAISRGGLYLYFANTKELFEAVLAEENADPGTGTDIGTMAELPDERIRRYLEEQKGMILHHAESLITATYEYLFENQVPEDKIIQTPFYQNVADLEQMITEGVAQKKIVCESTLDTARNIAYALEGMRIMALTGSVPEEEADREIAFLLKMLGVGTKDD